MIREFLKDSCLCQHRVEEIIHARNTVRMDIIHHVKEMVILNKKLIYVGTDRSMLRTKHATITARGTTSDTRNRRMDWSTISHKQGKLNVDRGITGGRCERH